MKLHIDGIDFFNEAFGTTFQTSDNDIYEMHVPEVSQKMFWETCTRYRDFFTVSLELDCVCGEHKERANVLALL